MSDVDQIVTELKALVARPGNDFSYSWWDDAERALAELDAISQQDLATLFLPTSGMQELAIRSGWGEEFNALADRFDLVRDV